MSFPHICEYRSYQKPFLNYIIIYISYMGRGFDCFYFSALWADCYDEGAIIIAVPSAIFFLLSRPFISLDGSPCFSSSGCSLFMRVNDVLCFYSLTSLALSFIKKIPVPGFSKISTTDILLEWYGCFISSWNQPSVMAIPYFFGSSSEILNRFFWAPAMMSCMYYFLNVHITPKKNSRSGNLFESYSFDGKYLLNSASFIASS